MHDPMTVAFRICWPWYRTYEFDKRKNKYWRTMLTIWHVDPERDGSDDSCGWFRPPLTKVQKEIIHNLAGDEARDPWFRALTEKENRDPVACETLVRGAFLLVSLCLENRCGWRRWRPRKRSVSLTEATIWAIHMVHNPVDNFRSSLAFLSGWHGNNYREDSPNTIEEDKWFRERSAQDFFSAIMGYILRQRRPWYRKPRWHVWHWQLQWEDVLIFKRWAFSKCAGCGKGFSWGYSPTTTSWHGTGPRWFRSEPHVYHSECLKGTIPSTEE